MEQKKLGKKSVTRHSYLSTFSRFFCTCTCLYVGSQGRRGGVSHTGPHSWGLSQNIQLPIASQWKQFWAGVCIWRNYSLISCDADNIPQVIYHSGWIDANKCFDMIPNPCFGCIAEVTPSLPRVTCCLQGEKGITTYTLLTQFGHDGILQYSTCSIKKIYQNYYTVTVKTTHTITGQKRSFKGQIKTHKNPRQPYLDGANNSYIRSEQNTHI